MQWTIIAFKLKNNTPQSTTLCWILIYRLSTYRIEPDKLINLYLNKRIKIIKLLLKRINIYKIWHKCQFITNSYIIANSMIPLLYTVLKYYIQYLNKFIKNISHYNKTNNEWIKTRISNKNKNLIKF